MGLQWDAEKHTDRLHLLHCAGLRHGGAHQREHRAGLLRPEPNRQHGPHLLAQLQ